MNIEDHIMPRMKDIVIDTLVAVKPHLNETKRKNCFELLGYDFLIDEDFRVWLIEVNNNPHLGAPNDFMEKIVDELLNETLTITLDPMFQPMFKGKGRLLESDLERRDQL
jgi:hypothetical protein